MSLARQLSLACAGPVAGPNALHAHPRIVPTLRALALAFLVACAVPAEAQVVDVRPVTGTDDAEERADLSMYTGSSDLELTFDGSTQTVGIRWSGLTIPPGATITSAWIQFHAAESHTETTNLVFAGHAADNPAGFTSTAGNISTRPRTAATVPWSPAAWTSGEAGAAQRTPDLKTVLQEIVSRPGWASGNALVLIITGTGHRTATAYNGSAANAPLLHVEYTSDGTPPPTNTAPTGALALSQAASPALTVNASAAGSTDNQNNIASYTFAWGDGTSNTTVTHPTQTASHTYTSTGTKTVTLTVRDAGNLTSTPVSRTISVTSTAPANTAPSAVLTVSQDATPARTVTASAAGSNDAQDNIASYTFAWGDGTANTTVTHPTQVASHTYAAAGNYTVTLTAKDTGNLTSAAVTKSISVNVAPVAAFTVSVLAPPAVRTVTTNAAGSTDTDAFPIANYRFDWGDGTPATTVAHPNTHASHSYAAAGSYTITLTATDTGNLASAPVTQGVTVNDPPPVLLDARPATENDDAEESAIGSVATSGSDLELVFDGSNQIVGLRWPALNINRNATITNAYVQFTADESQSEVTNLTIQAQAADNAAAFSSSNLNVSSRPRTAASVAWPNIPAWSSKQATAAQRTPELKTLIQEIVNRPGWTNGNAIALIITGTGHRTAEAAAQGNSSAWARLHVESFGGTPPPNQAPVAALNVTASGLTVNASAAGSTDNDPYPIVNYRFTWGDNTPATVVNAPTQTASHSYAAAGTYTVTVVATDAGGLQSAPVTRSVTVSSGGSSGGLPIAVWASYYSTHHSYNIQPKPSPWMGSPNVVFVGTPDSPNDGGWDSAGIKIDNLSGGTLTMTVTCDIGSKRFALWGSRSVPAGQSLILAQTGFENFDGSDTNPAGCYDCDPRMCLTDVQSTVPVVNITMNGTTTKFYDPQQTINTNGVDYAGCPKTSGRNDESRGWVRIYTSSSGTPPAATNMYEGDPNTKIAGLSWLAPVFPNPVRMAEPLTLQFNIGEPGRAEIAIYDVAGRLVKNELTREFEPGQYQKMIPMQGLSAGMYWCTLTTREGTLKQSFTIR